jgi:predicted phage baseplate assembly protein
VEPTRDPLTGEPLIAIVWADADALPFDLPIAGVDDQGIPFPFPLSVAYGNVVLADAGRTQLPENLLDNPGWSRRRPRMKEFPLTRQGQSQTPQGQWQVFDPAAPAQAAMQWSLRNVKPAIALWEKQLPAENQVAGPQWQPQQDLLISDRFARDFVVEAEEDGRAFLRFGDGTLGKAPKGNTPLYALYRTGTGQAGNVGADTLVNIVVQPHNLKPDDRQQHLNLLRSALHPINPLPAQGGVDPEPLEQVRLDAPQAFREVLGRAVTEKDYETLTEQYPGVQRAVANRRWTGSWHTIFIAVDRADNRLLDDAFQQGLLAHLEKFRLAGHDVAIESPQFVPLDIALQVRVKPDYFRSNVKTALLDSFSNRVLPGEVLGFFHPNQFTFGQPVYLSKIVAQAMGVEGVTAATVTRFERWGNSSEEGLTLGSLRFDQLEIAQLDNLPNLPENGRLTLALEGGL